MSIDDLRALESELGASDDRPRVLLRVTAPVGLGQARVMPAVIAFRRTFPDVKVDVSFTDRIVDLVEERIDVAVRMTVSLPLSFVAKRLADDVRLLCASPDYVAKRGRPRHPRELARHECVAFVAAGAVVPWKLKSDARKAEAVRIGGGLHLNNLLSLRDAALAGLGIADLPAYLVGDDLRAGRLVSVLDDFVATQRTIHAIYIQSPFIPARVREFIRRLADEFADAAAPKRKLSGYRPGLPLPGLVEVLVTPGHESRRALGRAGGRRLRPDLRPGRAATRRSRRRSLAHGLKRERGAGPRVV
jgi:DNA-binding transcriptional LysR family regulator